ncbi:MAG: FAD-dependent oxidoreductase [Deltaproteobacteria bacterium]|nr:FAD-dependent oxidoreductase [Deltaproteobacteria bacterium]
MPSTSRLLDRREIAGELMTFRLERPAGYEFRAGQFCFLELPDLGFQGDRGLRRHLSLASSPTETDLLFGTRKSQSAFKQTLAALPLGSPITIEEPRGSLALPEDPSRPLVFLAGGIGITPFRSLLRYAADSDTSHRVTLFYSNRRPEETLFLEDLLEIARGHDTLRVLATMTRMGESSEPWDGLTGRLTAATIREHCPEWPESAFYLAGPPAMVETLEAVLQELGIDPSRIRPERFTGY